MIDPEDMVAIPSNRERQLFFHSTTITCSRVIEVYSNEYKVSTGNKDQLLLLVTSAVPKEGSPLHLRIFCCDGDVWTKVLLIDADLRRPSIHRLFEMTDDFGTVDLLTGERTIQSWFSQVTYRIWTLLSLVQHQKIQMNYLVTRTS